MKQVTVILGIIALTFMLIFWFGLSKPEATRGSVVQSRALTVSVEKLELKDHQVQLRSFGLIEPEFDYKIHALVAGHVVTKNLRFKNGERVRADDVLLEIDDVSFVSSVAQAQAELSASKLNLEDEKARAQQALTDWNKRNPNQKAQDYVLRIPHVKAAESRLSAAKVALHTAKLNLERTKVRAGFDGLIRNANVRQGEVVSTNTLLGEGFSTNAGIVKLPVNANELNVLAAEGSLGEVLSIVVENTLLSSSDQSKVLWPATFLRLEAGVDTQTQQVTLVARVDSPFDQAQERLALLPDQYVSATITGQVLRDVIVVPNSLIYQNEYVYLATGDSLDQLERRTVKVIHQDDTYSVIGEGLKAGDMLITTALGQLSSGTLIKVAE
ncbi:MAG: efflux RND transporter periplasmic adaptor subunit [Oleiphilaceae bacterium]|nr:efflux RND transporter periplasmic adaptor subunit [Oleiphilaceae bacterium]